MMSTQISDLFNLDGKVAIVTGGAGWLGRAISEALAQAGANIVIIDSNAAEANDAVETLSKNGLTAVANVADVMQDKPLRNCIDQVATDCGRLDILVNCAYEGPVPQLDQAKFADFDTGMHNGPGAYGIAAQQAARHMRLTGGGAILNIASMYGIVTGYPDVYEGITPPNSIVYQAGKAAIIHMTRHMAVYWAKDNIRVNCISPGPFPKDTVQDELPELIKRLEGKSPMGRIGRPSEIKGAALFLVSDAASYVTGQSIQVDGGWTIW